MQGIADYAFVEELREGNHGRYYLARPPARLPVPDDVVVVKVLAGESTEATFRRATRELRAFAAVQSPFLVRLYDAGQQGSTIYYAMEHLPLGSLGRPSRPLSRAEVLRAVEHAARAAHALHEGGLVHRDIKPDNVLLAEDGGRLADLGLAQLLQPGVTMTGLGPVGSVEYVDPAVLGGASASRQTDVYGLGMTLHRAVTGRGVFGELPADQPLLAIRTLMTATAQLDTSLGSGLAALVSSCIAKDLSQRPATALAVADTIAGIQQASGDAHTSASEHARP